MSTIAQTESLMMDNTSLPEILVPNTSPDIRANSKMSSLSVPFLTGRHTDNTSESDNIHRGIIEFFHEIPLESILMHPDMLPDIPVNYYKESRILCLMIIPSFMIPGDIIHYFAGSLDVILSMRILRHQASYEKYLGLIQVTSGQAAKLLIDNYHGQSLTSLEPTVCILYPVKNILLSDIPMYDDVRLSSPGNSTPDQSMQLFKMPSTPKPSIKRFLAGLDYNQASTRKFSPSPNVTASASANTDLTSNDVVTSQSDHNDDDSYCVVCLDPISNLSPKSFTTCCQHSFHIECISRLEGPQCPVCRFQHDSTAVEFSCCSVCGWQGLEAFPGISPTATPNAFTFTPVPATNDVVHRDLWVCLVCGFIGCGISHDSHINRHYEESLHTYAMNTDSGRVWDFAGDGFVHRLILSQDSSSSQDPLQIQDVSSLQAVSSSSSAPLSVITSSSMKVVEVSSPHNMSHERSRIAPMTRDQEERIINAKLEATAYHYNQLVRWQLERNREVYEMRLRRVREFAAREGEVQPPPGGDGSTTWAECVKYSLAQERGKIHKQCDVARTRLKKLEDELSVLLQFQSNLEANLLDYRTSVQEAKAKLARAEKEYRETIPALEREVQEMMKKLDES